MDRETRRRLRPGAQRRATRRTPSSTTSLPESATARLHPARDHLRPLRVGDFRRARGCRRGARCLRAGDARQAGGRLRLGLTPIPKGTLEPWTYQETAALQLGGISGEFLNRNRQNLTLAPELAVSWAPNNDASEWTYKLRQNVKFANGKPMNADDVLATYQRLLTDPTSQARPHSAACSPTAACRKVDDCTVKFTLDNPTASFPYLTSNTTYQAIILPKDYVGPFEKTPQTTGAFNLVAYTPGVSASYDRNPSWWGGWHRSTAST